MSFEKYFNFFENYENGVTVRPNKTEKFTFFQNIKDNKRYRLFVTGQTSNCYLWKNEPDTPLLYRLIDDALDNENALNDQYCLDLSAKTETDYIKRVYKKILWKPLLFIFSKTSKVVINHDLGAQNKSSRQNRQELYKNVQL